MPVSEMSNLSRYRNCALGSRS